jgi:alkanesulfonate monooxygenase SsuD/methylene tetrahydromethanopterin reductase-like flavin-dependent oxidoreductase (luciferase family)
MKIPPRRVVPKPIQKPHPRMWMACVAPDSYQIAGDRGLGGLSFTFNFEAVEKALAKFRKACTRRSDQIPKFVNEAFATMVICHVVDKKADESIGLDGARWFMHYAAELFKPFAAKGQLYSYEYMRHAMDLDMDPKDASDAQLKEHPLVVVGTPDEVIRKLERLEHAGVDQVICLKQAGAIPHPNIMRSMELMGRHVLPHFKASSL